MDRHPIRLSIQITYSSQLLRLTPIPIAVMINMFIIALVMIGWVKIAMTVAIIVPVLLSRDPYRSTHCVCRISYNQYGRLSPS
jgi:hypothetical protein